MTITLKVLVAKTFTLTKEEAKSYITDAKVYETKDGLSTPMIDIYHAYRGMSNRVGTIEAPKDFDSWDRHSAGFDDRLLEYAQNNLPDNLFIDRT